MIRDDEVVTERDAPRWLGWRLAFLLVMLAVWELAGRAAGSLMLPTASATAAALCRLLATQEFWRALLITHQALAAGFAAAVIVAIPLGLALGRWTAIDRWVDVHLQVLLVTPMSAVMPLFIVLLGVGLGARAVTVFAFAFPVMVATARAGLRGVDARLLEMARAFGAAEWHLWTRIFIPGARPAVAVAVRLGLSRSLLGMIAVELLLVAVGIGRLILKFQADFDAASVYAIVSVVALEAVVLTRLARTIERTLAGPDRAAVPA